MIPKSPRSDSVAPSPLAESEAGALSTHHRLNILCAEDDEAIARLLQAILATAGHSVDHAPNGQDALRRIQANPAKYDLLITDHDMPELDGLELVHGVRQTEFSGSLIVHSSALTLSIQNAYRALQVSHFLAKPEGASRLLAEVAQAARPIQNPDS